MSDVAIRVEGLGKRYQLNRAQPRARYQTLQSDLLALPRTLWSRATGRRAPKEEFWALRDVSFEVCQGEALGIIGHNGAGKSTLLKLLSRITPPSSGVAEVYGRIGSLLEVGTGFHPELTGLENIYLSGAVLGMTRQEVRRKLDEIIDFAGVEKFIDTPAKHYSSGMYMRLAFAVAAHLEPEILLVDEVLAVGDAEFQKKCLGKMDKVAQGGRTVLFVSHNMAAVQRLCARGLLLEQGRVALHAPIEEVIRRYTAADAAQAQSFDLTGRVDRSGDGSLRFLRVHLEDEQGQPLSRVLSGQAVRVVFDYESPRVVPRASVEVAFNVYNSQGVLLTNLNTRDSGQTEQAVGRRGRLVCRWPRFNLRSGVYTCALFCQLNGTVADWMQSAFQITVDDGDYYRTGSLVSRSQGDVLMDYDWYGEVDD